MNNIHTGYYKDYPKENDSKISTDDIQYFISTETRNWIIRDSNIRRDGSILNAVLLPRAKIVKARKLSFHTLTRGERIN